MRSTAAITVTLMGLTVAMLRGAQEPAPWRDPSPHRVQMVTVEENVRIEVLDWGTALHALAVRTAKAVLGVTITPRRRA